VEFFRKTIEGLTVEDQGSVVHVARMVYRLYGDIFRGLPA
jgi:hypothetical protein